MARTWLGRQAASSPPSRRRRRRRGSRPASYQKRRLKDSRRARRARRRARLAAASPFLGEPVFEQAQGVVPERVDLDRLAAARRHHPVADLGVHPGELVAFGALAQQAVGGIDADAEARAAQVVLDDVQQLRQEQLEGGPVAGDLEVAVDGVEEPERRVGGVVEAFLLALGEHVGDEAVADVMGEGAQDPAGLGVAAGGEGQALRG